MTTGTPSSVGRLAHTRVVVGGDGPGTHRVRVRGDHHPGEVRMARELPRAGHGQPIAEPKEEQPW